MKEQRKRVSNILSDFKNRLYDCDDEIEEKSILIAQLENPLKAVCSDGMPRGSKVSDTIFETVAMIENYNKDITRLVTLKEHILAEFERYIGNLKHNMKVILRLKYMNRLKISQISAKTNYSEDHIKKLIGLAQDELGTY